MCYSARTRADYTQFVRHYGAEIDLKDFFHLYWLRRQDGKAKAPRALDSVSWLTRHGGRARAGRQADQEGRR